ncbi:unnamed protein product [Rotaria sp. Silwood1]|nr:unnamed protein product [Rotaria sp. Silwood1]
MRRLEVPVASNIMSATTPQKRLNGKYINEAGNQLEFLLFDDTLKSIGDLDAIYLLKQASWDAPSIEQFKKQLNDQINQDIAEQPKSQSHRLQLPGKHDELDILANEEPEYDHRITIGACATGIYQHHLYCFDDSK